MQGFDRAELYLNFPARDGAADGLAANIPTRAFINASQILRGTPEVDRALKLVD